MRQPERPHKQRLDRVRLLALVVDGVLEAVAVLPYYRLAPPDFFGRNASQDVERLERSIAVRPLVDAAREEPPRGVIQVAVERRQGIDRGQRPLIQVAGRVVREAVGDVVPSSRKSCG